MKCRNWIERLPSLLDEDPRSPGRRQLEAHIGSCRSCRSQWTLMNRIKAEAGRLDGAEPGNGVWQGIEGELAGQEAEAPKKPVLLGPMVRLALGWGASLAVVLAAAVWIWPRFGGVNRPQAVDIGPAADVAEVADVRAAEAGQPVPVPAARKRGPSATPESPTPREPRYLVDNLASAEDLAEPVERVQYIMPVLEPADLEGTGGGQQYIMPAVCATVREPF